jgi:hypothetical protein
MPRLLLLSSIAIALLLTAAAQAESITTQLFDARGNRIGSATQTGDTTIFYDARGNPTGSVQNDDRKK